MTNMKIDNIIGGKDINLSKQYFKVKSQFYKNFELEISDSNDMEVSIAISKVKQSWEETQQLSFNDRIRIINSATKELNFTKDEIDSIVKLIGMPITYIKEQINQIPIIMNGMWSIISNRYGFKYGKLGLDFIEDKNFHKIEFRTPRKGFVYAITPGNDPRITSLVITILVLLGIPGIIKPSKTDSIIPQKIVRKIIDAGYPKNSLALLFFNSEKEDSKKLHFKISTNLLKIVSTTKTDFIELHPIGYFIEESKINLAALFKSKSVSSNPAHLPEVCFMMVLEEK